MSHKLSTILTLVTLATTALTSVGYCGEVTGGKHIWVPPVEVTQALKITMETKATEALLKKADERCVDADCHQQLEACRKVLATCVIVPSPASVHEQEMESN